MKQQIVVIIQTGRTAVTGPRNATLSDACVCVCVLSVFTFIWFSFGAEVCIIILASVAVVTKRAGERSAGSAFSRQSEITSPLTGSYAHFKVKSPTFVIFSHYWYSMILLNSCLLCFILGKKY